MGAGERNGGQKEQSVNTGKNNKKKKIGHVQRNLNDGQRGECYNEDTTEWEQKRIKPYVENLHLSWHGLQIVLKHQRKCAPKIFKHYLKHLEETLI